MRAEEKSGVGFSGSRRCGEGSSTGEQAGQRNGEMPGALWEEASTAARSFGVHRVARALRLNYEALRRGARDRRSEEVVCNRRERGPGAVATSSS